MNLKQIEFLLKRQRGQLSSVILTALNIAISFVLILFCLSIWGRVQKGESSFILTGVNQNQTTGKTQAFSQKEFSNLKDKKKVRDYRVIYNNIGGTVKKFGIVHAGDEPVGLYPYEASKSMVWGESTDVDTSGAIITEEMFRTIPITRSQLLKSKVEIEYNGTIYSVPITGVLDQKLVGKMELPKDAGVLFPRSVIDSLKSVEATHITCIMDSKGDYKKQVNSWKKEGRTVYEQSEKVKMKGTMRVMFLVGCMLCVMVVLLYSIVGVYGLMKLRAPKQEEFMKQLYAFGIEQDSIRKIYIQDSILIGIAGILVGSILGLAIHILALGNLFTIASYFVTVILIFGEQMVCTIKSYKNMEGWRIVL